MTHPTGNLVFSQGGAFTVPRSYLNDVIWDAEIHLGFTQTDSLWTLTYSPLPLYRAYVKIRDEFWNWSSNAYTLDHIIEYCYEQLSPSDPETDALLFVFVDYNATIKRPALWFRTVAPGQELHYSLPPRTAPYWTPDPP